MKQIQQLHEVIFWLEAQLLKPDLTDKMRKEFTEKRELAFNELQKLL